MVIGSLRIVLHIPNSHSLKEKRQVIRSLTSRLRRTFNVAVAEVGDQDVWQRATLAVVAVSGSGRHADEICQKALHMAGAEREALVTESHFELVHM